MATEVDICNLAISHMGHDMMIVSISPPDGSAEADACAAFYPIARDELLEQHAWRFAITRESLATLDANPSSQWLYAYALPNGCVRPLAVLLQGDTDDKNGQAFTIEVDPDDGKTPILLTNAPPGAILKFVIQQTDTTKFTPNFVIAVSYRLASYLAGKIPKDLKLKEALFEVSEVKRLFAASLDAKSEKNDAYNKDFIPSQLQARND